MLAKMIVFAMFGKTNPRSSLTYLPGNILNTYGTGLFLSVYQIKQATKDDPCNSLEGGSKERNYSIALYKLYWN